LAARCPLCNRASAIGRERIPVDGVVKLYRRLLRIEVADEFGALSSLEYHLCAGCDVRYFGPPVSGSERFYQSLQAFAWYYMDDKNEYGFAAPLVKACDDVLEIGCGKGAFARLISCRSYLGLEYSNEARLMAEKAGVTVVNQSIQEHSVDNAGSYDVVCSFQVLEHVSEARSFIESAVACLKAGGLLIVSTPSADSFAALVPNFILDMPPHHVTRWTDLSFERVARLFDLELVQLWHEPLQPVHRQFYLQTVLVSMSMRLFGRQNGVWDDSFLYRMVYLACRLPSRLLSLLCPGALVRKRGVSVTAVYRKPARGMM